MAAGPLIILVDRQDVRLGYHGHVAILPEPQTSQPRNAVSIGAREAHGCTRALSPRAGTMAAEQSPCPCCGCQTWTNAGRIRESFTTSEAVRYLPTITCARCGVRRLAFSPSQHWVDEWYANAPYGLRARSDSWSHRLKMLLENSDSRLASAVRQAAVVTWLPRPPFDGAKMLDVGCASGDLMAHAARLGWRPTGCEASALLVPWLAPAVSSASAETGKPTCLTASMTS